MAGRFLVIVSRGARVEGLAERARLRLQRLSPMIRPRTVGRLTIAATGDDLLEFAGGTVVGSLFGRDDLRPIATVDDPEARRIVASRGQRLIERYWGSYVAILGSVDETLIVRAPFGELPCYHLDLGDATACASDPELLVAAGLLRPAVDFGAIIREIAWRDFRGRETCLAGLTGLHGGDRLTIANHGDCIDTLWSPWNAARREGGLSAGEMADRIRRDVVACVTARASSFKHVLLLLSGGLDSSIVAASLAESGTAFSLASMTTRDALGDELGYARAVAGRVERSLHEALRDVGRIAPDRSTAARLPRPAGRLFEQETARIAGEIAALTGAQAIITGGGGDNVFCSLQSAAPVADRLLVEGPGRAVLETARQIGRLAPASVPAVLWAALERVPRRNRRSSATPDLSFLGRDAGGSVGEQPHPWLAAPAHALPGQAAHIKLLAAAESFMQGFDPEAPLPMVAPLLAQPLVESCLAVPSWYWFADGLNRALARRAFTGNLPDLILGRASKGSPDSFVAEIYERYRLTLREQLLDGVLVAERILDPAAIDASFTRGGALVPAEYRRLLRLADVESWARAWVARAG